MAIQFLRGMLSNMYRPSWNRPQHPWRPATGATSDRRSTQSAAIPNKNMPNKSQHRVLLFWFAFNKCFPLNRGIGVTPRTAAPDAVLCWLGWSFDLLCGIPKGPRGQKTCEVTAILQTKSVLYIIDYICFQLTFLFAAACFFASVPSE